MNWLAHTFLSPAQIDFQLGNLLTDIAKGKIDELFVGNQNQIRGRRQGWQLHISIDQFTDVHPIFNQSKSRFGESGRLRGVVVDLIYDHFLTKFWESYSNINLEVFLSEFHQSYQSMENNPQLLKLPDWAIDFLQYLWQSKRLSSYHSLEEMAVVMNQLDGRIRSHYPNIEKREKLMDYRPLLNDPSVYRGLEKDFLIFFPQVMSWVGEKIDRPEFWRFSP